MKKWMLLILLLFAVFAGSIIWAEQTLSPLRAQTETAWEAADAAILRRTELVPALTAQTGRYTSESQDAAHAAEEARQRILDASSREARMAAHDDLSSALGRLLLAADAYGGPGQDARYRESRMDLAAADNALAVARQGYNESARQYNKELQKFPGNRLGQFLGFHPAPYFRVFRPGETE